MVGRCLNFYTRVNASPFYEQTVSVVFKERKQNKKKKKTCAVIYKCFTGRRSIAILKTLLQIDIREDGFQGVMQTLVHCFPQIRLQLCMLRKKKGQAYQPRKKERKKKNPAILLEAATPTNENSNMSLTSLRTRSYDSGSNYSRCYWQGPFFVTCCCVHLL